MEYLKLDLLCLPIPVRSTGTSQGSSPTGIAFAAVDTLSSSHVMLAKLSLPYPHASSSEKKKLINLECGKKRESTKHMNSYYII